ncbi:YDG domain-containing protein, partial [Hyphomonas beringensis]|uniref:YDG domain-containing protein n=1 Tax=Hyphomonas beringensis TaxID=1280946 RepID=UPI00055287F3
LLGGTLGGGIVSGDDVTLVRPATGLFANKNVGQDKAVMASGYGLAGAEASNYRIEDPDYVTGTIMAKTLTITGVLTPDDRIYNGLTGVILTGGALDGVVAADMTAGSVTLNVSGATGEMDDKNAGLGKTVTASGYTLEGMDKDNYVLTQPTGLTVDVAKKTLTIMGVTADSRVYDATRIASVQGGTLEGVIASDEESVVLETAGLSALFADKNVGEAKTVTVSGYELSGSEKTNYTLVQPEGLNADITKATLYLTGLTAESRAYDATTSVDINRTGSLSDVLPGDDVNITYGVGAVADKDVGDNKLVSLSGFALTGVDGENYDVVLPDDLTVAIVPALLTVNVLDAKRSQNDPNPVFESQITGFVPGEDESYVSGLSYETDATAESSPGAYTIFADGASAPNYEFTYVDGTLTVTAGLTASSPISDIVAAADPAQSVDANVDVITADAFASENPLGEAVANVQLLVEMLGGLTAEATQENSSVSTAGLLSQEPDFIRPSYDDFTFDTDPSDEVILMSDGSGSARQVAVSVTSDSGDQGLDEFLFGSAAEEGLSGSSRQVAASFQDRSYWGAGEDQDKGLVYKKMKPKVNLGRSEDVYYVGSAL